MVLMFISPGLLVKIYRQKFNVINICIIIIVIYIIIWFFGPIIIVKNNTTKTKGTGLGLSIVKKIIEDHAGSIKIEKNKGMAGTTASIIFNYLWNQKFWL